MNLSNSLVLSKLAVIAASLRHGLWVIGTILLALVFFVYLSLTRPLNI